MAAAYVDTVAGISENRRRVMDTIETIKSSLESDGVARELKNQAIINGFLVSSSIANVVASVLATRVLWKLRLSLLDAAAQ